MNTVTQEISMELLSDAIFGSGYSIPGGEDIAVCQDEAGYPYVRGSTLKGLLREGAENILDWSDLPAAALGAIFGEMGWSGGEGARRLKLSDLTLKDPPANPADCYESRAFTSLSEAGVAETGTLRSAQCVRRGLVFTGVLVCAAEDVSLLKDSLACVKWAGSMRGKGFGRVRLSLGRLVEKKMPERLPPTRCIHYRLFAKSPVIITDLSRSQGSAFSSDSNGSERSGNAFETHAYIPGSSVRGLILSALAARDTEWFEAHKGELLTAIRFSDAFPCPGGHAPLPFPMGFYEDKAGKTFQSIFPSGSFTPGLKRARPGQFCALTEDGAIEYWNADIEGVLRIQRGSSGQDSRPFSTRCLRAGQTFDGCILLEDEALAPRLAESLSGEVWLGADRHEGFGRCEVTLLEAAERPAWIDAYGPKEKSDMGETLYLMALSPFTMLDPWGEPCGLDTEALAEKLGIKEVKLIHCATRVREYGGYNRTWQCRVPGTAMYDRGSVFQLACTPAPTLDAVRTLELEGLGIRRTEGFGQVLFLSQPRFEGLKGTRVLPEDGSSGRVREQAELRRARYRWVMEEAPKLQEKMRRSDLSSSQLGDIQALCEKALSMGGNWKDLNDYLERNEKDRGARHGSRFKSIAQWLRDFLDMGSGELIPEPLRSQCKDSAQERLKLICLLLNYSRKGKEEM